MPSIFVVSLVAPYSFWNKSISDQKNGEFVHLDHQEALVGMRWPIALVSRGLVSLVLSCL